MAETKVEQVARAICRAVIEKDLAAGEYHEFPLNIEEEIEAGWRDYIPAARAAIEATRTPTEAMRRAGAAAMPVCFDEEAGAISCWQAMHDAILKEEGNG